MSINSISCYPSVRYRNAGLSAAVRGITVLNGVVYGVTYAGGGTTQMSVTPYLGTSTPATLTATITAAESITNDGTFLYVVEEQTASAAAASNKIYKVTTAGTVTALQSSYINMRCAIYDPVNVCLYVSAPFDSKIVKVTGGGIGGNADTFTVTDFITSITNKPGRLQLNAGATKLYFTTEATNKQLGVVSLSSGVPGTPVYYDMLGSATEKSSLFLYVEAFDAFLHVGGTKTMAGTIFSPGLFSMNADLPYTTASLQGVMIEDNSIVYPDGTNLIYSDLAAPVEESYSWIFTGSIQTTYTKITGWNFTESASASAVVRLREGSVSGVILAEIKLGPDDSAGEQYVFPIRTSDPVFIQLSSGSVQGALYGR